MLSGTGHTDFCKADNYLAAVLLAVKTHANVSTHGEEYEIILVIGSGIVISQ